MSVTHLNSAFTDRRGIIKDILVHEPIESVVFIQSNKGSIRGNHYHKQTFQWTYILSGKVKVASYILDGPKTCTIEQIASAGDLIMHSPNERHAFLALEDTEWIVLTRGPRGGKDYESDTYRLEEPLIK